MLYARRIIFSGSLGTSSGADSSTRGALPSMPSTPNWPGPEIKELGIRPHPQNQKQRVDFLATDDGGVVGIGIVGAHGIITSRTGETARILSRLRPNFNDSLKILCAFGPFA